MFVDIGDYLINASEIACIKPYNHKQDLTFVLFKSGEGAALEVDIKTLKDLVCKALISPTQLPVKPCSEIKTQDKES